jgi:exodeoxyribonuclease VII large subunit
MEIRYPLDGNNDGTLHLYPRIPILASNHLMQEESFIRADAAIEPRTFESPFYSPSSIVAIFNAATVTREEKKLIGLKGIFKKSGAANYNGFYYNKLKDEASDYSITLVTPTLLHNKLDDNKTIECNAFITRKLDKQGRIEIHLNLVELLAERINSFSEEDARKIMLLNKKVDSGFKDLDAHIKTKIFNNEPLNIKLVMGKSAIIDSDIKKGMESAIALYNIEYHRVSLSAPKEIIAKIQSLDSEGADIICVARGGGENLQTFDDLDICESILDCKTIIASAIGHADNVTLFEKLSDKKFITPTQFGNYLKEIYNSTVEELQQSKAKLVNDITQQLSANFKKQVDNLNEQLRLSKELHEKTKEDLNKTYAEKLSAANTQLKHFRELSSKTSTEKAGLHEKETQALKTQINSLFIQINSQEKLIKQAEENAWSYKRQLNYAKERSRTSVGNIIAIVIITLIIGLIIGVLLAKR